MEGGDVENRSAKAIKTENLRAAAAAAATGAIVVGNFTAPTLAASGVYNSGGAGEGGGVDSDGTKILPPLANIGTGVSSDASLDRGLCVRGLTRTNKSPDPRTAMVETSSVALSSKPNLAPGDTSNGGGGREPDLCLQPPTSPSNRGDGGGIMMASTTEDEIEASSSEASDRTRAAAAAAAAAQRPEITKILITKNKNITINKVVTPFPNLNPTPTTPSPNPDPEETLNNVRN